MQRPPSRALQDEFRRFQSMGQQLEMIAQQKAMIENSIKEKNRAIEEVETVENETPIYKQIGGILIKSKKDTVLESLKDEKLTLEMRKKKFERNETSMKKKFEEMRAKLQSKISDQEE